MLPRIAATVLLLGLAAGCSGGSAPTAPPPDPAAQARDAVSATFNGYAQSLLRRDFPSACAALTDDAKKALVADLNTRNIPAQDCAQAYAALYATDAATALDEQGRTIRITDVRVNGATASLTYTGSVKGRQISQTIAAREVAGGWQIAPGG